MQLLVEQARHGPFLLAENDTLAIPLRVLQVPTVGELKIGGRIVSPCRAGRRGCGGSPELVRTRLS